ncbi:MAG: pyridoxamine 5'-phosphate oxidase family protein [Elusimicrobiota bacterium]|jgi:general stress protein 26|nr:pyridoxamine 5'-phosphate oxidase family protein [Elusimicrobiota bacterium]
MNQELKKSFKNLIEKCKFCNLSNINADGFPETRAMLNLANPSITTKHFLGKDFSVYFTTNTSSEKFKNLLSNSKTSIYYVEPDKFCALLLIGETSVIEDEKIKKDFWQSCWTMYYKEGLKDPEYQLFKFTPIKYKYYDGKFAVQSGEIIHTK